MLTSAVLAPQQSRSFSSRLPIVCFVSHMLHENEEKKGWCGIASARQASRSVSGLGRREDAHLHPLPSISAERTVLPTVWYDGRVGQSHQVRPASEKPESRQEPYEM